MDEDELDEELMAALAASMASYEHEQQRTAPQAAAGDGCVPRELLPRPSTNGRALRAAALPRDGPPNFKLRENACSAPW